MIHLLRSRATQEQLTARLEELTEYVKLAVDIKREVKAIGAMAIQMGRNLERRREAGKPRRTSRRMVAEDSRKLRLA